MMSRSLTMGVERELARAAAAVRRREAADEAVRTAVVSAYRAGASLRRIAASTGLSHETVRKLLREAGVDTRRGERDA